MSPASLLFNFARWDSSRPARYFFGTGLLLSGLILLAPLVDKYNEYCFEADAQSTVNQITNFRAYVRSASRKQLAAPNGFPPYLDGQFIVFTAATYLVDALRTIGIVDASAVPTESSLAMYTVRRANVAFRLLAALAMFLLAIRVTHSALFSATIGLSFLLMAQLIQIDLLRVDHVIIALFVWVVYFSLASIRPCPNRGRRLLALALVSGALATTKISCVAFLLVPLTTTSYLLISRRLRFRNLIMPCAAFSAVCLALSFRYVVFFKQAPTAVRAMLDQVYAWNAVVGNRPHFYYNLNLFAPDGPWFLGLAAAGFLILLTSMLHKRRVDEAMVLGWTACFSLMGYGVMKYVRGGYHIAVLYLLALLMAAGVLRRAMMRSSRRGIVGIMCACCVVPVFHSQGEYYIGQRHRAELLSRSTQALRVEPRNWLRNHVKPGSRVTIPIHSEWALPPIFDLGFDIGYRFLNLPYLDPKAVQNYRPPSLDSLSKDTDIIIVNDFHRDAFHRATIKLDSDDLATRWEEFFEGLPKAFTVVDFSSSTDNYGIRFVRIVVVNPDALKVTE